MVRLLCVLISEGEAGLCRTCCVRSGFEVVVDVSKSCTRNSSSVAIMGLLSPIVQYLHTSATLLELQSFQLAMLTKQVYCALGVQMFSRCCYPVDLRTLAVILTLVQKQLQSVITVSITV